jgi:Cytochrome P450
VTGGLKELRGLYDGDPTEYYDAVQASAGQDGIVWDESLGGWLVTSYALCDEALRSRGLARQLLDLPRGDHPELVACAESILARQLMFQNDVEERRDHWRTRLGVERSDDALAEAVLAPLTLGLELNNLYAVLQRYASMVAASSVGLPEPARTELYPLIWRAVAFLDGKLRNDSEYYESMYAVVALYDRLGALFRDLQTPETLPDLLLALVAGHESIAFLLATLFTHVPWRIPAREFGRALVEALRFDSPVQLVGRRAIEDMSLGTYRIATGSRVYCHIGAANRDPAIFERPNTFDRSRSGSAPIAFGAGAGECVGRSLAMRAAMTFVTALDRRGWWFETGAAELRSGIGGRGYQRFAARVSGGLPETAQAAL